MARRIPKYRLHKGSGQALVQIDGRRIYIGKYDSPESHEAYDRVIAEWLADSRRNAPQKQKSTAPGEQLTISELLLLYWRFAKTYYVHNGEPTRELESMKEALRPVRELYGHTIGCDFGPLSLKAVRQHMIERDLCRGVINNRVGRIKRFFKWAVSEELIPASVHESLKTVSGLQFEKSEARETDPVRPADEASVQKLLRYMAPPIRAMVELQRQTGMRSGEIVIMRPATWTAATTSGCTGRLPIRPDIAATTRLCRWDRKPRLRFRHFSIETHKHSCSHHWRRRNGGVSSVLSTPNHERRRSTPVN